MAKSRSRSRRVTFVTGMTENYFLMCGTLMESLDRHFPLIPFLVMDFGLSEGQKEFFRMRGMLLPMPAGFAKGEHPFKLKSSLGTYLGEDFGVPVWIDADIIAIGDGTDAVFELAEAMAAGGQRFAIASDQGIPGAGPPTLAANCRDMLMPALSGFVRDHPQTAQRPYLNTGVVMFREADTLADWRTTAEAFSGDQVWEQNAFNALCHLDPDRVRMLDARTWNAHGGLLDAISIDTNGSRCDGMACYFAHATSSGKQITWGDMDFEFAGSRYRNFVKFFSNPALRGLQMEHMNTFLESNLPLLRKLGILAAP
jgi:hypothetical protein